MEHRLPSNQEDQTLWEGDQLTIRFLLEEGKLNLCVRLMHEYKKWRRSAGVMSADTLSHTATSCDLPSGDALLQKLASFEQACPLGRSRTRSNH